MGNIQSLTATVSASLSPVHSASTLARPLSEQPTLQRTFLTRQLHSQLFRSRTRRLILSAVIQTAVFGREGGQAIKHRLDSGFSAVLL